MPKLYRKESKLKVRYKPELVTFVSKIILIFIRVMCKTMT